MELSRRYNQEGMEYAQRDPMKAMLKRKGESRKASWLVYITGMSSIEGAVFCFSSLIHEGWPFLFKYIREQIVKYQHYILPTCNIRIFAFQIFRLIDGFQEKRGLPLRNTCFRADIRATRQLSLSKVPSSYCSLRFRCFYIRVGISTGGLP
ncbi:hypothetical protein GQ43DRAFT_256417 [Delitschia confertaspora ATCC 74209]|uniref:Uncharacterized protein n=1 Tax=Delitschia confertaspora ATCC 74209 TaxID=1513339 RepID=A0A9P4MS03_9PLEO|nr:hypothetical protein GQ43DRAFT_256417 [Delitschia confertaspora ATCC 74209]